MNIILVFLGSIFLGVLLTLLTYRILKFTKAALVENQYPYKTKDNFFTRSEWEFFRLLEEQADHSRFTIFPKVRLGDFIEVDAPKGERMSHWNKIKSKHVDFLVWDKTSNSFSVAIELDGKSHNSERMQKSDAFKDRLYPAIGLPLVRVSVGSEFSKKITDIFQEIS